MDHEQNDISSEVDDLYLQAHDLDAKTEDVILYDYHFNHKPPAHIASDYKALLPLIRGVETSARQFEMIEITSASVRQTVFMLFGIVEHLQEMADIISRWPDGFDGDDGRVNLPTPFIPSGSPLPVLSF